MRRAWRRSGIRVAIVTIRRMGVIGKARSVGVWILVIVGGGEVIVRLDGRMMMVLQRTWVSV